MGQGALAGQPVVASRVPDQITRTTATSDSAAFTTEATVISVTAYLFEGRTYRVKFHGRFASDDSADRVLVRMREDSATGTQHSEHNVFVLATSNQGFADESEIEFPAAADGNKTFVVTGQRISGAGTTTRLRAGTDRPATLAVEYLRG